MKTKQSIIEQLKQTGARITQARRLMIDIFMADHLPLSELEIRKRLAELGKAVNKTTVYRELEYLKANGIIREVVFGDGKKRYELGYSHHHHLICTNCRQVDEIHIEDDVSHIEELIHKLKNFRITSHSLEFFGLCGNCGME